MSCRASGIGPGMVNYADIAQCFPFDNEIVLVSIAGYNFAQTQFITGSSYYFVTWADSSVQWNVDSSATYYLVTDTYTSDFYDNYMTIVDYYDIGHTYARDLLAEYVKAGNWDDTSQNQHAGTISDPMTIADALEQAALYTSSGQSQGYFYKGTVSDFADQWSTSTGDLRNVKVCDSGDTNEMVIFYLKKFSGANLNNGNWTGQYDLVIGDEIIFYGKPFTYHGNYVNILEFASGAYCYSINGVVTGPSY